MKKIFSLLLVGLTGNVALAQFYGLTEPKRLDAGVNTSAEESAPLLSPSGKEIYFVRTFDDLNEGGINDQDIYVSTLNEKGKWNEAENLEDLNNRDHNAIVALSADGNTAYVLYANEGKNDIGKGIAFSKKTENGWSKPEKINIPGLSVNGKNVGFTVSSDGNVMIVSYEGPNSLGNEDLYYSMKNGQNWSELKHMVGVNSNGYEISPFLSANNDTLYFASNGFGGQGGCDIFYAVKKGDWNDWFSPVNMGEKINSPAFDAYLIKVGPRYYWSSNRNAEDADIYWAETVQPPALKIAETHQNVTAFQGADGSIDLSILSGVAPYKVKWSNGMTSEDLSKLKRGMYLVQVTDAIDQQQTLTVEITEPMPTVQKVIRFPEVRYKVNSWEFVNDSTIQSFDSLNRVAALLTEYPGLMLELMSHTDARGDAKKNLTLSMNRAKAVYTYLVEQKGIDPRRLIPVGKGETEPSRMFDPNTNGFVELTEEYINQFKATDKTTFEKLHQINRRTEGKIIGISFDPTTAAPAPKEYLMPKPK